MPMIMVRLTGFMLLMAMAAAVPRMQAARADTKAINRVLDRAARISGSDSICWYQLKVNPPHWVLDLEVLKDRTIMVRIGAYRKIRIRTR